MDSMDMNGFPWIPVCSIDFILLLVRLGVSTDTVVNLCVKPALVGAWGARDSQDP